MSEQQQNISVEQQKRRQNITEGSILSTILRLAWPVTIGMLMEFALHATDFYWVGHLGHTAQDAITSSMVVIWTMFALISLVTVGVTAVVSRYVGANDYSRVEHLIRQGLTMAVGLGILVGIAGWFATPLLQDLMQTSIDTRQHAIPFLRVFFITALLFFLIDTAYAIFRAAGDTKTPMIIGAAAIALNMALDPLLIFGYGFVPGLGVVGASIATGIFVLVGTIWTLILIRKRKLGFDVSALVTIRPDGSDIRRIAKIGLPMSSQQLVFVSVYWFLIRFVHEFGEVAGAAMGIGNRMESLSYLTCFGISLAASTMVGQNLGAKKPDRAARCAWGAAGIGVGGTAIISLFFIFIPETIAGVFTDNPEVLSIATDYLIILGLSQSAMAIEIILEGAFGGAGDTMPPMIVQIPGSLLRIPLAWYLVFQLDWGINGVWWTLTFTSIIKAIVMSVWFKRNRWQLKQV
jgi:putative MATE family efflux protein